MQHKSICFVDIETTSIPASGVMGVEAIHCISVKSNDEPTLCYTSRFLPIPNYGGTLKNALDFINTHKICVGHNFMGFDLLVIENLLGELKPTVLDTMIVAKLLYTKEELSELDYTIADFPKDKYGSFSLDAFGRRMGEHKGSHSDWSRLSVEMCNYCTQDVEVTYHLYHNLISHKHFPSQSILDLEHEVAYIIAQQVHYGFYFSTEKARQLMQAMMYEQLSIEIRLQKIFRPMFLADGPPITPAGARRNKLYLPNPDYVPLSAVRYTPFQYTVLKNKSIRFKKIDKWFTTPHRLVYSYTEGEYQKIKLTKFDPGSRHKIRHWLYTQYGFVFSTFTEKGTPKVEGDELEALGDYGVDLRRYLKIVKDLSQLKGLIDAVRPDSTITSRIDTNGTVTGRFTSSNVNLNQIPSAKEFRELFVAPEYYEINDELYNELQLNLH